MGLFFVTFFVFLSFIFPVNTYSAGFSCDSGTLSDTCTVTSLKNIDANDIVSGSGNLIIGSGGELRVATSSFFSIEIGGDIIIQSGGKITGNLRGATSTNFTIDIGGMIDVSGRGYAGGTTGIGYTCSGCEGGGGYGSFSGNPYGGGGSYGGRGANAIANEDQKFNSDGIKGGYIVSQGGNTYGSTTAPTDLGSGGGGGGASYPGGYGGGAVKIITSGTFTLNGTIRADGSRSYGSSYYTIPGGGSGGSIWIQTGTLSGTGSTTANGGYAHVYNTNGYGGTGGGGRIAIYYTTDNSSIQNYAYSNGNYGYGGAGTIYKKASGGTLGTLLVDNNRSNLLYPIASTTIASDFSVSSTTIIGGAVLHINDNVSFNAGSKLSMSNYGRLVLFGTSTIFSVDALDIHSGEAIIDVFKDINSVPGFGEVNIYSGGRLTHSSTTYPYRHYFSLIMGATNFNINNGGLIDVSERGYAGGTSTPGFTCSGCGGGGQIMPNPTYYYGGGGGYGGNGANGGSQTVIIASGGNSYGSTTAPTHLGSGGGGSNHPTLVGGYGGGAVKLVVSNTLTINGSIRSNGMRGTGSSYSNVPGGGSGGSIWLQAGTLSGTGSTTANGGTAHIYNENGYGGTGGGGRIAIYYTTDNSSIQNYAYGNTNYKTGGAGTIYKKASGDTLGSLLVDNNRTNFPTHITIASTTVSSNLTVSSTTVTGGALLQIPSDVTFTVNDSLNMSNLGGIIIQATNSILTANTLNITSGTTTLDVNKDIVTPPTFTTVTVNGNSTLSHSTSTYPSNHLYSLILNATNLTINSGGAIDVSGRGFLGGTTTAGFTCSGCGGGGGYGKCLLNGANYGSGGSYGGNGGYYQSPSCSLSSVTAQGSSYGSTTAPTDLGSGGGGGGSGAPGGNGGGAMKLTVSGTLTNNGWIRSDGVRGVYDASHYAGGGSGGSIWLQTDILSGNGSVTATGGTWGRINYPAMAGSGGGGRIAVYYNTDNSTISYLANGAGYVIPTNSGGAGTIYTKASSATYGDLLLNNAGYLNASTTALTNFTVASTTVTGGALLQIPSGVTFTVNDSLNMSNLGGIIIQATNSILTVNTLNITSGSTTLDVNKDIATPPTFTTVTVNGNSTLSHSTSTYPSTHLYSLILNATNLTINSGGAIDVTGKGFLGGTTTAGFTCDGCGGGGGYLSASTGAGGGHGGAGGDALNNATPVTGGSAYGTATGPVTLGSGGGGSGSDSYTGGNGGGAIKLIISGALSNSGFILANGSRGWGSSSTRKGGGGAGGSIWISAGSLSCSGSMTANGGNGWYSSATYYGGGGGGGLIKVSFSSGSLCSTLTASAGTANSTYGLASAGSVSTSTSPTLTTASASSVTNTNATLNGSISVTGGENASTRGFAYGLTTAYGATTTDSGSYGVGDFTADISGLSCNTTYHFKAYATNSAGTGYGSDNTFLTSACSPTLSTSAASSVGVSSAIFNGSVSSTGGATITIRGFAYGLTTAYGATTTDSGSYGVGDFSTTTTGLNPNTTYHYKAFATNSTGISYGSDQQFITSIGVPSVSTDSTTGLSGTGAILNATIGDIGGDTVTTVGFAYGLTTDYTSTTTNSGSYSTESFTETLSGLTCGTTYHIRAYASNSTETGYGTDQTFTTSACPTAESNSATRGNGMPESIRFINGVNPMNIIVPPRNQNVSRSDTVINQNITNSTSPISNFVFKKPLRKGSQNSDVRKLQEILAKDPVIYPEGLVTGYFGSLTEKALIKFQIKNNIVKSSEDVGAGHFGPKTRAFINK